MTTEMLAAREALEKAKTEIERLRAIAEAAWEVRREERDYTPVPDLTLRAMYRKNLHRLLDDWQAAEAGRKGIMSLNAKGEVK